jgi:tripartite-type tricarboxylate transporter receptor subunit TctC
MSLVDRINCHLRRAAAALAFFGALGPALAAGSAYPERPVRVIVPFGPGGAADVIMRVVAEQLGQEMGQPFVVENRPGAGGTIGTEAVARSRPDGYTIGIGSVSTHATSVSLYPRLNYDPRTDFTPIYRLAAIPNVMVVPPSLGVRTLQELIDLARKQPDRLNFGSNGNGTSQHLGGELFKMRNDVRIVHVPYRNIGSMVTDLIAGQVQVAFDNLPNMIGHIKAGKLVGLGVTTRERWPDLPDVPTYAEMGISDFDIASWIGIFAPAGLPEDVASRLETAVGKVMASREVLASIRKAGAEPRPGDARELASHVKAEIERWATVVKASGAKLD